MKSVSIVSCSRSLFLRYKTLATLWILGVGVLLAGCQSVPTSPKTALADNSETVLPTPAIAPRPIRIGLALGGGAARGFAHIGVIKALESQGIYPDIIVGTSAGSVVGSIYAFGKNGYELQKIAMSMNEAAISDWSFPLFARISGVLKGEALTRFVNDQVGNQLIERFPKRFGAVATDLATGEAVLFTSGNAGAAVRASSAVPGVFQPVALDGHTYVDGGLVAPVPSRYARQMGADFVIAVNISAVPATGNVSGSVDVMLQTFAIMGKTINDAQRNDADVTIVPSLPGMKGSDFGSRNHAILAGEQAAMASMPEIRRKLAALRGVPGQ